MFFLQNKLKWEDLTHFNFFNPPYKYDVGRNYNTESSYNKYKNKLIQQGVDINNVIKNIYILGLDIVGMDINSKIVSDNKYNIICRSVFFRDRDRDRDRDRNINNNLKSVRYSIAKNTFPYYLQNNIVHNLLWLEEILDYKSIKKIILDKLFDGDEKIMSEKCVFFRNRKDLISIDNIPHIHIFIKL